MGMFFDICQDQSFVKMRETGMRQMKETDLQFYKLCAAIESCLSDFPPSENRSLLPSPQRSTPSETSSAPTTSKSFSLIGSVDSRVRIIAPPKNRHGEPVGHTKIIRKFADPSMEEDYDSVSAARSHFGSVCSTTQSRNKDVPLSRIQPFQDRLPSAGEYAHPSKIPSTKTKRTANGPSNGSVASTKYGRSGGEANTTSVILKDVDNQKNFRKRPEHDPVRRHQQYKQFWASHPAPGENPHNELRWNIRAKLMKKDYETALMGTQYTPKWTNVGEMDKLTPIEEFELRNAVATNDENESFDEEHESPDYYTCASVAASSTHRRD